jgi:hypothetical protein
MTFTIYYILSNHEYFPIHLAIVDSKAKANLVITYVMTVAGQKNHYNVKNALTTEKLSRLRDKTIPSLLLHIYSMQ